MVSRCASFLVASIALVLLTALPATAWDMSVRVLWRGQPMVACDARLVGAPPVEGQTDAAGWVVFRGLVAERSEIHFEAPGFFRRRMVHYNFTGRDVATSVDLKKRIPWTLSGQVTGAGLPVESARILLDLGSDQPQETLSDAAGRFTVGGLDDVECRLRVRAAGHPGRMVWLANRDQVDRSVSVELDRSVAAGAPDRP